MGNLKLNIINNVLLFVFVLLIFKIKIISS